MDFFLPIALTLLLGAATAAAQSTADPIGAITPLTISRNHGAAVQTGRTAGGDTVCFMREQGDSHRLDIGVGRSGAFVRLESPEPPAGQPTPPVRIFAGLQQIENDRATSHFLVLARYKGKVTLIAPSAERATKTILATDTAAFLDVVAAAKGQFIVVEGEGTDGDKDWFAVYDFDKAGAAALIACARGL